MACPGWRPSAVLPRAFAFDFDLLREDFFVVLAGRVGVAERRLVGALPFTARFDASASVSMGRTFFFAEGVVEDLAGREPALFGALLVRAAVFDAVFALVLAAGFARALFPVVRDVFLADLVAREAVAGFLAVLLALAAVLRAGVVLAVFFADFLAVLVDLDAAFFGAACWRAVFLLAAGLRAGLFFAAVFFAGVFFAGFLTAFFFGAAFLAVLRPGFFAAVFFAAGFLAGAFFAGDFFVVARFGAAFLAGALLAFFAGFLAAGLEGLFAAFLGAAFFEEAAFEALARDGLPDGFLAVFDFDADLAFVRLRALKRSSR